MKEKTSSLLRQGGFGCIFYPSLTKLKSKSKSNSKSKHNKHRKDDKNDKINVKPNTSSYLNSRDKFVSKVQMNDFNAKNEMIIGEKIKKIPHYSNSFLPVVYSYPLQFDTFTNKQQHLLEECDFIQTTQQHRNHTSANEAQYVVMEVPFMEMVSLREILSIPSIPFMFFIRIYDNLIQSIQLLYKYKIIHFDIKMDNILIHPKTLRSISKHRFNLSTNVNLRIIDFGLSLPLPDILSMLKQLNKNTYTNANDAVVDVDTDVDVDVDVDMDAMDTLKSYFYGFIPEYYVWCLDIHIINYLLHEKQVEHLENKNNKNKNNARVVDINVNKEDIPYVIDRWLETHKVLQLFPPSFRHSYKSYCERKYAIYSGQSIFYTIQHIIEHNASLWDLYSLNIILLRMIGTHPNAFTSFTSFKIKNLEEIEEMNTDTDTDTDNDNIPFILKQFTQYIINTFDVHTDTDIYTDIHKSNDEINSLNGTLLANIYQSFKQLIQTYIHSSEYSEYSGYKNKDRSGHSYLLETKLFIDTDTITTELNELTELITRQRYNK
jgi:hypothetical protein